MCERDIFLAARGNPDPAARTAFLDEVCAGDATLRRRIDRLLRADGSTGSVLDMPVTTPSVPNPAEEVLSFLEASSRPDALGRIGHYEILEILGRGGFGVIFRAFDEVLERIVAVKVLSPQLATTSSARKRFLREARSAAAVRHENVVQVHAVEEQPLPYLVMEYISGETLQQRLDRDGLLEVTEVVRLGREIAAGLAAAHGLRLVHRDVKPANVLLEAGPRPRARLTDFGLARPADDISITQAGVIVGTPAYMPPEQARGDQLDPRCDLYSLGCVLYRMATGTLPIKGNDTLSMLMALATNEPVPPRQLCGDLPLVLSELIMQLLAKDREKRPASAGEVVAALAGIEQSLANTPSRARQVRTETRLVAPVETAITTSIHLDAPESKKSPARSRGAVGLLSGAVAALLVLGVLAGIAFYPQKGKLQDVPNDKGTDAKDRATKSESALALKEPSWVPDKSTVALPGIIPYPALRRPHGRWQILPTAPAEAHPFAESPDGRWVAVWKSPYVTIYDAHTGALAAVGKETKEVAEIHLTSPEIEWSPDSKWVRSGFRRGLGWSEGHYFAVDGSPSPVPYLQQAECDAGWNPKYPVVACTFRGSRESIQLIDPARANPLDLLTQQGVGGKAVWSPDGDWLLVVRANKTAQLFGRDGKPGVKFEGSVDPSVPPVWTADGSTIAALARPDVIGFWKKDGRAGATCQQGAAVRQLWWHEEARLLAAADEKQLRFWTLAGASAAVLDSTFYPENTVRFVGRGVISHPHYWPKLNQAPRNLPSIIHVSPDGRSLLMGEPHAAALVLSAVNDGDFTPLDWRIPNGHAENRVQFSRDRKRVYLNDLDGLAAYDSRDTKKVMRFGGRTPGQLKHIALSPKGDRLAVGSVPGFITICDPLGQPLAASWQPLRLSDDPGKASVSHPRNFFEMSWHPDGRHLLALSPDTAVVFDSAEGKRVASLSPPPGIWATFAPDNPDHIVFTSRQLAIWRWKHEREPAQKIEASLGAPLPSPDGKWLLCRSTMQDRGARDAPHLVSLDLKTRTPLLQKDLQAADYYAPAFAWLPDGKHLLAGTQPLSIRSLDGKLVETIPPVEGVHTAGVERFQFAPDGKSILGWAGNRYFLLNLADRKLTPLTGIRGSTTHDIEHNGSAAFSLDSQTLITPVGSTLLYWKLATRELERIVLLLPDAQHVIFSPAGEVLARSKHADQHYRHIIEDRSGGLQLKTAAEFEKLNP